MTTPAQLPGQPQHLYLAKVIDLAGYWSAWTGGETSITVTEQYDGGADEPDLIPGRGTVSNVTLRRPFKPARDMEIIGTLLSVIRTPGYIKVLVLQPLDDMRRATGSKIVLPGSRLMRVGNPQVDADSETGSSYELEFRPPRAFVQ